SVVTKYNYLCRRNKAIMKRTLFFIALASLALASCKKADTDPKDEGGNPFELPYNKEGVTANKAFLEKEGRDFVDKIEDLSNNNAIKAFESLADLEIPELSLTTSALLKIGQ